MNSDDIIPLTAKDALAKWDRGESVFTIECGGLGPGYEQCIQILTFELIRDYLGTELPIPKDEKNPTPADQKAWREWGDAAVTRCNLGFSGAQVGAAKNLAFRALRDGWRATVKSVGAERHIQVSRTFPQPPERVAV
jgi:hypothetical protein